MRSWENDILGIFQDEALTLDQKKIQIKNIAEIVGVRVRFYSHTLILEWR